MNKAHLPTTVSVNKTSLHGAGRSSILLPCDNSFEVKTMIPQTVIEKDTLSAVFERTPDDERPGSSQEDMIFFEIMGEKFYRNASGRWTAPLPFKPGRARLPNNYTQAIKRARNLHANLQKNPVKMDHALTFMDEKCGK